MKLLLIEDDITLVTQLVKSLQQRDYEVDVSHDGEDGLYRAEEFTYDLAIVDLGLPKISGLELIRSLRAKQSNLPILILTARSSWQDKVEGLNAGADDFLVKPFQLEELVARVQAMMRRSGGYASNEIKQGSIKLNLETQDVWLKDQLIQLTAFEYKLLHYFLLNPGRVISKSRLNDYLYDEDSDVESNVIEVLVRRLRLKLDPDNTLKPIETLRGRGYRFSLKD